MVVLAGAVVIEFSLSLVGAVYGTPSRSVLGPASSFDTSGTGTAALAQLLRGERHLVRQLENPLRGAELSGPGTLFVLDPQKDLSSELSAIRSYLGSGGRVVLAGRPAPATLKALLGPGALPRWQETGPGPSHPGAPEPENYAASTVLSNGDGSFKLSPTAPSWAGAASILLGGPHGALALIARVGQGRLVLLASSSPLDNANLPRDDNAAFALDLAGPPGTAVTFDEYDHLQSSSGSGIAGLPGHWQAALALGLLAVIVWILSAARRFGPPEPAERALAPARVAHVDAVAALLASGPPGRLIAGAEPLRRAARARLCSALGAGPDAPDSELWTRAGPVSITPDLVTAILTEPRSQTDLLALGKAYVALARRGRWS